VTTARFLDLDREEPPPTKNINFAKISYNILSICRYENTCCHGI
jgi:hypothetical protein